ncbi:zinc finger, CCHC-type containing protein [Tanacetum coccineum]
MVNSMLSYSGLSQGFWGEAMAVVRLSDPKLKTLGERGIECIFVGYTKHSKAFRFYVIESNESVSINSIIESKDAIFDENKLSSVLRPNLRIPNETKDIGGDEVSDQHSYCFNVEGDPKTFDEAMKSQDVAFWKEAINDEMDLIMDNNTLVLDDLPLVARISTIRLLIAMASIHNLIIHQMDVKTSFLNGEIDKEVYMNQPQGFIMPGNENKVKFDDTGKGVIICLYVDDMLLFDTNQVQVDLTKEFLSSKFSMKDMGEADFILGIRIKHKVNGITISQSYYIEKDVSQLEYSRVIGCLMYAMTCTRPDIAFVVSKLSRYTSNPGTQHWQAIQRVLKYLKKTMDCSLTYTGYPSVLEGYTDASWISYTEDNSSTSGWVFLLGGGAISWASKKQTCITSSTMESKFVALAAAGKEAKWLRNLILEIPLWSKPIAPNSIRCDSVATLSNCYYFKGNRGIATSVARTPQRMVLSKDETELLWKLPHYVDIFNILMHDKKPDLSFFHVFGSLCYPTNDSEDLGKLNAKENIGIFVGYAPAKKAFRIYSRRTRKIIETIHVTFDELIAMASKQFGSGPGLQVMTTATSSSGRIPNIIPQQPLAAVPRAVEIADSLVSTSIDQDAPSSKSPKTPLFHDDPFHEPLHEDSTSQGSSSNVRPSYTPFKLIGRWTKDHPTANMIGDLSRSVSTKKQLKTDAMWCYFDALLTYVEPKNFKQAMIKPS